MSSKFFDSRAFFLYPRHSPPRNTSLCTCFTVRSAMIGKMADEKEFDEKAGNSDSDEEGEDEEENVNGRNSEEEDESEFDDPEDFVDDITDEG